MCIRDRSLDIGYGYTHDGGKSYPFRGKGIGKMPSLTEVLDTFPKQKFLVNIKSNSLGDADLVDDFLNKRQGEDLSRLWFYGGTKPTARLLFLRPELKGFTKPSVKSCFVEYALLAWSGYIPDSCRNTIILIPNNYAPYLWGWPSRFSKRMAKVNTEIIYTGEHHLHTRGIDDPKEVQLLSKEYRGILWTNKIEKVGSLKLKTKDGANSIKLIV